MRKSIISGFIAMVLVFTFSFAPISNRGTFYRSYLVMDDVTINGASGSATSTTFEVGDCERVGYYYEITEGTSTAHVTITWHGTWDVHGSTMSTVALGEIVNDESTQNYVVGTITNVTPVRYIIIKVDGESLNATNTTIDVGLIGL